MPAWQKGQTKSGRLVGMYAGGLLLLGVLDGACAGTGAGIGAVGVGGAGCTGGGAGLCPVLVPNGPGVGPAPNGGGCVDCPGLGNGFGFVPAGACPAGF